MFYGFECIQEYIDDILIITNGDWSSEMEKMAINTTKAFKKHV